MYKFGRKTVSMLLAAGLALSAFGSAGQAEAAAKPITVTVDGNKIGFDVKPVIKSGRVLVPFRALFEEFGAAIDYDNSTKMIRAWRDGQTIELKVDSKRALVDGNATMLDVPAAIINGRALVPLRFISENYQGYVNWNSSSRSVAITSSGSPVKPPAPKPDPEPVEKGIPLYLNNQKVEMDLPVINKNNKVYVPLKQFVPFMGSDISYEEYRDDLYLDMEGISVKMSVGKNYGMVNGSSVQLNDMPIREGGAVYVPVRLITDLFGGSIQVSPGLSEIRLLINRTKLRSEFLNIEQTPIIKPVNIPGAEFSGNRRLMISDNPENLNKYTVQYDNVTLWEDEVNTSDAKTDHRVYGWHVNDLGKRAKLGITIENLSQTNSLEVTDIEGIDRASANGWANLDVGLPLAEAVLSDKLSQISMQYPTVKPGETALINSFSVDSKYLIGFLKDFTVRNSAGGNASYKIRVVLTQNEGDLTSIKDAPVPTDKINSHPRGVWKSAELTAALPAYQAGSPEIAYSISNGDTDNLLSAEASIGSPEKEVMKNSGHYGAVYKVSVPIINDTGEAKTVRVRLSARGGKYDGAIKVNGKVYMVPSIKPAVEVANVIDYTVTGPKDSIELEIMHSGGAALPLAIDVLTLN
ncbi:copper amine oxidase N-terminal domain-containing protein [Bacillus infantis]|uniref:stalk domain-containing protein n=1 Tax=Bacillus infantis TaxID=324767 RepID=UPI001CD6AE74|nr:copper amine oxidase N-terminal domain-containing protein [Bacillus infantis]MCA1041640.1 copper amine oxidase N-terminal domain-containing protein [Bacillus infantis]